MAVDPDRERLRRTFDRAAERYDRARPTYPAPLLDRLVDAAGVSPGDHLLEVGCGTGQATVALAERGFHLTCVEPGHRLAEVARRNVADHPVEIVLRDFESFSPGDRTFDLVVSATAWHWVDPDVRYRRAWEVLRTGGHLAFWTATHVVPDGGDPFFADLQHVYDEIGEAMPGGHRFSRPGELRDASYEIERSGLFEVVTIDHFDWETTHDADGYIDLLETFSGHLAMAPWQRERLFGEIRARLGRRADGRARRHWGAVLHVARRRDTEPSLSLRRRLRAPVDRSGCRPGSRGRARSAAGRRPRRPGRGGTAGTGRS
ncbi:MAG: methyltransferase domain-containing protein [Actinomycetota bacterium]|nr:methyltransferase domain-containing protein [Actinomycetota bacterium]